MNLPPAQFTVLIDYDIYEKFRRTAASQGYHVRSGRNVEGAKSIKPLRNQLFERTLVEYSEKHGEEI